MYRICPEGHVVFWPNHEMTGRYHCGHAERQDYACNRLSVGLGDHPAVEAVWRMHGPAAALELLHTLTGGKAFT